MSTAITSAGTYGAGDYHLDAAIASGLTFIGVATLDLNGHTVADTESGDTVTYGVRSDFKLTVMDRKGGGRITGFWAGIRADGAFSYVVGVNVGGNRYMGIQLEGDECRVNGCIAEGIGGITAEPYAIAVQCNGARPVVTNCHFANLYRQVSYAGSDAGEGLAVNLSVNSVNGTVRNVDMVNDTFEQDTIGVFAGATGGHRIEWLRTHNVLIPVVIAQSGTDSTVRNVSATYEHR